MPDDHDNDCVWVFGCLRGDDALAAPYENMAFAPPRASITNFLPRDIRSSCPVLRPPSLLLLVFDHARLFQGRRCWCRPAEPGLLVYFPQGKQGPLHIHPQSLTSTTVNRVLQWRSLIHDRPSLYPWNHLPHRIFSLLDRTTFHLRCASLRARPRQTRSTRAEMVLDHFETFV